MIEPSSRDASSNAPQPSSGTLHEDLTRTETPTGTSDRRFGLTIAAACGGIGMIRLMLGHGGWAWWIGAGALFALSAVFRPIILGPLNRFWLRLGLVLYKIVNPAVMALIFVTTIIPVGILMRLSGKDPLRLNREPNAVSYWIQRDPADAAATTMRNQF